MKVFSVQLRYFEMDQICKLASQLFFQVQFDKSWKKLVQKVFHLQSLLQNTCSKMVYPRFNI